MSELLERVPEVRAIDEALDAAGRGRGRLLLFEAPAGLGKSTLLDEARRRARGGGFEVLAARGRELERDFPFGVARQLFEARLRAADEPQRRRLLEGSAARTAELLGVETRAPAAVGGAEQGSPFPLLHGLHWLAANLADLAPLALVVDDAHWADELSLRFVAYLAARVAELPVALFVARRPGERGPDGALLAQLVTEPAARVMRPAPLSEPGTHRLVQAHAAEADTAFAAACHEATAGNPFLLTELLAALEQEGVAPVAASLGRVRAIGPEPVSRAVYLALRALEPEATAVARAIAVLGDGAPAGVVAELARIPAVSAAQAAAALDRAGLVRVDGGIGFVHPIVGRAIYEELDAGERAAAHRAAIQVLQAAGAAPERVAAHALKAAGALPAEVPAVLRAAAADAMRRGAPTSAARYLRRALQDAQPPEARAELLVELGRAEAAAAEPAAAERLREALRSIGGGPERRATLASELGTLLHAQGRFAEAADAFDQALAQLGSADGDLRRSLEARWAAAALWSSLGASQVRARVEPRARAAADPATRADRALLATLAGVEMLAAAERSTTVRAALRAWGDGALLERGGVDDPALWAIAAALAGCEAWDELAAVLDRIAAAAREADAVLVHATAGFVRAWRWLGLGAVGDALAEVDRALDARRHGWGTFVPAALALRARCLLERGDLAGAQACAARAGEEEARAERSPLSLTATDARARVLLAGNDPSTALATWLDAGEVAEAMGVRNPGFVAWRSGAALAAGRLDDLDAARRLADAEVAIARAHGGPRALGVALTARGTIERGREALPWLEAAVAALERSPARLDRAAALVQLGTVLRIAGRRTDAREPLRRGLDLADRCGAAALAARAREELIAAGGRPRRARLSGAAALTPSERRVAGLAASGLSNRETAEALFVTKKAVEFHLGNVYRKLGVRGRDQLAGALEDEA